MDNTPSTTAPKWKLEADYRERGSRLLQLARDCDAFDLRIQSLRAGDYVVNDRIVLERKTHADFALSIIDGRLFHQAAELTRSWQRPLILVEGPKPAVMPRIHSNALKGAILALAVAWRVPVIFTRDPDESLLVLNLLAQQSQAVGKSLLVRNGSRPAGQNARRLFVLQGLPGVGPTLARSLLEHFSSVEAVMNANEIELAKVEGCGPKKAALIRKTLTSDPTSTL
ncbi:MAG TPA: ERCC4 domain-containing protein [Acidobacteriota bacterium]|jgi:Fanconi anemia group M protein